MMATTTKRRIEEDDNAIAANKRVRVDALDSFDRSSPTSAPPTTSERPSCAGTSATSTSKRPKKFRCTHTDCDKAFDRPVRLEAHVRTHTNERPFVCSEEGCTKSFFKSEHLKAHAQNKHSEQADYVCEYVLNVSELGEDVSCGKAFTTGTRLRRHVAAHEAKEELKCQEVGCGMTFRKLDTLQRHIKKEHTEEDAFRCEKLVGDPEDVTEECGQRFSTIGKLKAHEKRQHEAKKYYCGLCSSPNDYDHHLAFPSYNDLRAHHRTVHPPICSICAKICDSNRALTAHIDIEHTSLSSRQKFQCGYPGCLRSFSRQGNLNVHVQSVHVKAKNFICGLFNLVGNEKCPGFEQERQGCGLACMTKATLENHVRTQHLDLPSLRRRKASQQVPDQQYKLNESRQKMTLREQRVEHADVPKLACWVSDCTASFALEYDLAEHVELVHGWQIDDVNERLVEEQALAGGQFWIGGAGESEHFNGWTENAQDPEFEHSLSLALQNNADQHRGGHVHLVEDSVNDRGHPVADVSAMQQPLESIALDPALFAH